MAMDARRSHPFSAMLFLEEGWRQWICTIICGSSSLSLFSRLLTLAAALVEKETALKGLTRVRPAAAPAAVNELPPTKKVAWARRFRALIWALNAVR